MYKNIFHSKYLEKQRTENIPIPILSIWFLFFEATNSTSSLSLILYIFLAQNF